MKDPHRYDDMLYMPHHVSPTRQPMSLYNRAAQFAPFAALTGYEEKIDETGRLTQAKIQLDEHARELLDRQLAEIMQHLQEKKNYTFTYFVPDYSKDGGSYVSTQAIIKKINLTLRTITMYAENQVQDGLIIPLDDIVSIT